MELDIGASGEEYGWEIWSVGRKLACWKTVNFLSHGVI
jgi:hypothetical protein